MSQVSRSKTRQWDFVEALSLSISVASSIAAFVLQQNILAITASLPLSVAIGLNSLDRRRLEGDIHQYKATIAQLERQQLEKFKYLDQAIQLLPSPVNSGELKTIVDQAIEGSHTEIDSRLKSLELTKAAEIQEIENQLGRLSLFQDSIYNRLRFLESFDLSSIEDTISLFQDNLSTLQNKVDRLSKETRLYKDLISNELSARSKTIKRIENELNTSRSSLTESTLDLLSRIKKLEVSSLLPPPKAFDPHVERILSNLGNQVGKLQTKCRTEPSPPVVGIHSPQLLEYVSQNEVIKLVRQLNQDSSQRDYESIAKIKRIIEEEMRKLDGVKFKLGAYSNELYLLKSQVIELIEDLKHKI
jgi:hypothetical protein